MSCEFLNARDLSNVNKYNINDCHMRRSGEIGIYLLQFKNEIKDVSNSEKTKNWIYFIYFSLSRKFHTKIPLFDDIIHRMFR